jgi:tRNA pseudouridine55 synthase
MRTPVNGILLLDKPANMTSNGALQRVKRLFNAKKAGHTGSLDPIATGMLPLCFGEATKFSQFLLDSDKSYHVIAKLGEQTATGDREGEVIATQRVSADITAERIANVMTTFLGKSEQIPPMFSAIKVQGKPLYELARKGIEIERKPRGIKIRSLMLEAFERDLFTFRVHCSKGTYVRTLVEDIARALGCVAHVQELRRLTVTPYDGAAMYTMPELEHIAATARFAGLGACLLPVETAVSIYPIIKLSTSAAFYIRTGQAVRASFPIDSTFVRLVTEDGRFIGVGEATTEGSVKPIRLLASQEVSAIDKTAAAS